MIWIFAHFTWDMESWLRFHEKERREFFSNADSVTNQNGLFDHFRAESAAKCAGK